MIKILIVILTVFLQQIALGGIELEKYVEHHTDLGIENGTLSSIWLTLPAPLVTELLREVDGGQTGFLLGYLTKVASTDESNRYAVEKMIVLVLYISAQSDRTAYLPEARPKDGEISLTVPRLFSNVVKSGFPQDSKGWYNWFDKVLPRIRRHGNDADKGQRIWLINIREPTPVSEVLQYIEKQSGVKVFYSAPKSGEHKIGMQAANISAFEAFRTVAEVAHLNMDSKEDGVHFTPKE
jgi:hypothetical protein